MHSLRTLLGVASLASLSVAQAPFPIMTKTVPTSIHDKFTSDAGAYLSSLYMQPAYTSASMALASENPTVADDVNGDPIVLAQAFLIATATPTWFTQLPDDVRGFVSSVAAAEATIAAMDSGAVPKTKVWVAGVVFAAGAVGMLLL